MLQNLGDVSEIQGSKMQSQDLDPLYDETISPKIKRRLQLLSKRMKNKQHIHESQLRNHEAARMYKRF